MLRRRFGRTGLSMPVLTCGGMRYQHSWKDVPPEEIPAANQQNLEATIRRAIDAGIVHIETARGYGSSEQQLGRILPVLPRDQIIVQTKVTPYADPAEFLATFETSLANLRLDHVDLLSLHGINTPGLLEFSLRPGGCLDAARTLQRQGRVRHIGFSTHAPLPIILSTIHSGAFDYVNLHWYYIFQNNWPAIEAAQHHDMGVFIISPNDKGGKLYEPSPKLLDLCQPLHPMVFNDLFCLSRPQVHTLSIGAARPSDFDLHIGAVARLDEARLLAPPIAARLDQTLDTAVGLDFFHSIDNDIPVWDHFPDGINVREAARLWCLVKAFDLTAYAKFRYNLLGQAEHWFPGHKAAAFDPQAILGALGDYPHRHRIPHILREAHSLFNDADGKRLSQSD